MANSKMIVMGLIIALLLGLLTGIILAASEGQSNNIRPPSKPQLVDTPCNVDGVMDLQKCLEQ